MRASAGAGSKAAADSASRRRAFVGHRLDGHVHSSVQMNSVARGDLRLLPQVAAHADEMFVVLSDPMIYQYENEPPPSIEWLRDRFARLEARRSPDGRHQWLNWVIQISTAE